MSAARRVISIGVILVASVSARANALASSHGGQPQQLDLCQIECAVQYALCQLGPFPWQCFSLYMVCLNGCTKEQ